MPPPEYPPGKYEFGVRVYASLEDLLSGGEEEDLPPGEYPYNDWGRLLELSHNRPSDGYYYQLRRGQQEVWQWQHILHACADLPMDETDSDRAYEDLPESFPDDPAIQFARGEIVKTSSSFRCWRNLRDAQNPAAFDKSYLCSGVWTVRDRGYYLDDGGLEELPAAEGGCYYFLELETQGRPRCWTCEVLLLEAMSGGGA